jgi:hypothetical protein
MARAAEAVGAAVAVGGAVDVTSLRARIRAKASALNLGPAHASIRKTAASVDGEISAGGDTDAPLSARISVPLRSGPVVMDLSGGPVTLAVLGIEEGDLGLEGVDRAELIAKTNVILAEDGTRAAFSGNGRVSRLAIRHPKLAKDPVRGIELGWRASGEITLDGSHLRVDVGELQVGRTRLELKGELINTDDRLALAVEGGIPLASCQDMLDSAPEGLAPLLTGMRMAGTFSLRIRANFDALKPNNTDSQVSFANDCRVTDVPAAIAPARFASTFAYDVRDETGRTLRLYTGPDTNGWVRYENISRYMEVAVLVNEDGRFFRHRGFDQEAISNSLRENLKARRFSRGASTVTMQLAKNLYLDRDKTLSRKLQEAVLTMLLEQELPKEKILELYLNVIEFGPGIYGIGAAAQYYFDTTAAELSVGQALYLGSILPKPKSHHFAADGNVSPGWSSYLRKLMHVAHKRQLITSAELEEGLREQVAFRVPKPTRLAEPLNETGDGYDEASFGPTE